MADETEQLQRLIDNLTRDEHWEFEAVRRDDGWWAVPSEARHFGDRGEYLGDTIDQVKQAIREMLA